MASKHFFNQVKERFLLSDDEALLDIPLIHSWLSLEAYWAMGRDIEVVERAFANSYPIGVYMDGEQVAIARIVSDTATFAWLCDVFVEKDFRGREIGTWLTEAVVEWSEKLGITRILLATRDAHDVYSRVGFKVLKNPERWMEIDRRI